MPLIWLWHWLMKILLEPFLYTAIIWDKSGRRGFDYFPWNAVMFRQIFGYFKRWGFDFGSVGSASKPSRIGRHIITIWGCTPKGSTVGAIMKRDVFYLLWQRVHKHHGWISMAPLITCSRRHRTTIYIPLRRLKIHWQPTHQHLGCSYHHFLGQSPHSGL